MIITAITIENFKSIKNPVRIELKPITMLFGTNSVGKSSVIQALHYAREILVENNPDADKTKTGGDFIRLGGFRQIVYNHDCNRSIRFKFEFNLPPGDSEIVEDAPYNGEHYLNRVWQASTINEIGLAIGNLQSLLSKVNSWFELVISYDSEFKKPYISKSAFGVAELSLIELRQNGKNGVIKPQLKDFEKLLILSCIEEKADNLFSKEDFENKKLKISPKLPWSHISYNFDDSEYTENLLPISKLTGNKNDTTIMDVGKYDSDGNEIIPNILDTLYYIHLDALANDLENFRYIGPLRTVPNADFIPNNEDTPSRWANGVAAWDNIYLGDESDTEAINRWLSEDYLNTGYKIVLDRKKEIALDGDLYKAIINKATISDEMIDFLQQSPEKTKLFIKPCGSEMLLNATDVGVGIAQVLPIVPLAIGDGQMAQGLVAIEQPELHTHPAMQVVLGDLFIKGLGKDAKNISKKRFILETHSQHMLLRVLKRIRQSSQNNSIAPGIVPDDISINYIERGPNGSKSYAIRVDKRGRLIDSWPGGFFEEDFEELF